LRLVRYAPRTDPEQGYNRVSVRLLTCPSTVRINANSLALSYLPNAPDFVS
jgi:hypothetical protein